MVRATCQVPVSQAWSLTYKKSCKHCVPMGICNSSLALKAKHKRAVILLEQPILEQTFHAAGVYLPPPLSSQGLRCLRTLTCLQKQTTWQPDAEAYKTIRVRDHNGTSLYAYHSTDVRRQEVSAVASHRDKYRHAGLYRVFG